MTVNINSIDTDNIQLMMAQMYQKLNAADTDGVSGLSKKELSSVNVGDDIGGAAFLKTLNEQFDALDKDKNGELTAKEIFPQDLLKKQMGPPPGLEIASKHSESFANKYQLGNFLENTAAFAGKLIRAYKGSGGLSNLASALNISG